MTVNWRTFLKASLSAGTFTRNLPSDLMSAPSKNGTLQLARVVAVCDVDANRLKNVRTGTDPVCPVEVGHRSNTICVLHHLSIKLHRRKFKWDPVAEKAVGDPEVDKRIDVPMRKPYTLGQRMKTTCLLTLCLIPSLLLGKGLVPITVDGTELVFYQASPLEEPKGGKAFKGSNFIHPLKTPSGFTVTDSQPGDHLHHFGLWWPWKFIEADGRKILCWELQKGDGIVEAREASAIPNGLLTRSLYLDRKAPDGIVPRIEEITHLTTSSLIDQPAPGYFLDLKIAHQASGDQPVTISQYRYSGLGFRGSAHWNKDTSTILTSEGNERDSANSTRARWVRVEGKTDSGGKAGVLLMGHPSNHDHPEKIRTWNKQHHGAIFVNFNPVMEKSLILKPGEPLTRQYRIYIYDGTITQKEVETLWKQYAAP